MSKKLEAFIEELQNQLGEQEVEIQIAMLKIEKMTDAGDAMAKQCKDIKLAKQWEDSKNESV